MSNTTEEHIKGKAEVVGGKIEKAAGELLGNDKMKHAGQIHEVKGEIREDAAKAAQRAKDAAAKLVKPAT